MTRVIYVVRACLWPVVALVLLWPSRNVPRDFVRSLIDAEACPSPIDLARMGWEYRGSAGKDYKGEEIRKGH